MAALGVSPTGRTPGGLEARGEARDLYRLNLHLRTASRVLVRLAAFRARTFAELERRASDVPWDRILSPGGRLEVTATCRKSRLYHSGAVEERLVSAAVRAVPGVGPAPAGPAASPGEGAGDAPALLVVARLHRDRLTLSADASGDHLHRRGYRQRTARAPLRETLAAAVLRAVGWPGDGRALVDPLCGSGTFPIEAALMARRIPPGWRRVFAFERWPDFDPEAWAAVRQEAEAAMRPAVGVPLEGSDRDAGAVRMAAENARAAGVEDDVVFRRRSISEAEPRDGWKGPGWIVTNPPWGRRIGRRDGLRDLYARLGQVARARFGGWGLAVLTATPELAGQVGPGGDVRLTSRNGNVPVRLHVWEAGG